METLQICTQDGVTTVSIHRPAVRNAFNEVLIAELHQTFRHLPEGTRVVVLTGTGSVFCAGADIEWMRRSATYTQEENAADAAAMQAMFCAIDEAAPPVIAKIQGSAMGGALGLIACCDVAFAAPHAKFAFSEVKLGLVPAVISPFVMRKIGASQARRYFLTAETFDAARAKELGLVHEVVDGENLDSAVEACVRQLLSNGPQAVQKAKHIVREVWRRDVLNEQDALDFTVRSIATTRTSAEGQEGLTAFLEKRKPAWQR